MNLLELIILGLLCIFQSIFGVGLLILGTPTFIFLGYNFFDVLNILLPYSIIISTLQVFFHKEKRDYFFIKKFCYYSIPSLFLGLVITINFNNLINFSILISLILIIFSTINIINLKNTIFKIKKLNYYLFFMGLMHGMTNLGGFLLTIIISNKFKKKELIRYNIALSYLIFAIIQLTFINFFYQKIILINYKFLFVPFIIFFISQLLFNKLENNYFHILLNFSTLFYGIFIFVNQIF
tara:strand:+ start:313 stop:1026 length:714 start_codon:yes stop_codon:yes gene_type:complete